MQIDMVSDQNARWPHYHPEIPTRMGNICDVDKFDAQFFGVHFKQAETLDPQGRMLLERAYEAITDAGINPRSMRGSKTGVFIGGGCAESEKTWFYEKQTERGFGLTGYNTISNIIAKEYELRNNMQFGILDVPERCWRTVYRTHWAFKDPLWW